MSTISADFENIVLTELKKAWHRYVSSFKWPATGLNAPLFKLHEGHTHWGEWTAATREMSFSHDLITKRPWAEVLEIEKHEMAHQYVSEVLHMDNEPPHGKTFFSVCKQFGIDAAVRGAPGADKVDAPNHIVEKIRHLLDLAAGGKTEAETQAAANAAHNMMLKYNIELQEKNEERGYTTRYLGDITGRIQAYMNAAANLLSKYYFVEIIWLNSYDPRTQKRGHELEVSGTVDNCEAAEYVYQFITSAALAAWDVKFADPSFKDEMKAELQRSWQYNAPHSVRGLTISARTNFLQGFIQGFASQLKITADKEKSEGLVLAKDPALEAFYRTRYPRIRNIGGKGGYDNYAWKSKGFSEGKELKLPLAAKPNKQFIPLLGK